MDKRKQLRFVMIITMALVIELVVCNFSFWRSLFYGGGTSFEEITVEGAEETSEGSGEYVVYDDRLTMHISGVNRQLHNIFLELEFAEDEIVPYTVMLTDEGNYYPYALPEKTIVPDVKKSYYTNIYPSGKVKTIDVQFSLPAGSTVSLGKICGNVHIPFMFSLGRFLFILAVLLLFYNAVRAEQWKHMICQDTNRQRLTTAAVILILMGLAWALVHVNPICITSPWPHHKQYQELAEALSKGHLYLDAEPSAELLNVDNPYDTIYLQANGIHYLADYAYYNGKYYVYFGIVPELLLYLPFYILTGNHLPNYIAVFLFYCGFILAVFALYREIIRRWFAHTPYFIYLMTCVLTVCCGNYLFVIARPDLYDTPIIAANMFTVGGLFFWLKGKYSESSKFRRLCYFLGSLSMALVAGCRPQMLLFSLLALPLFWEEIKKIRSNFTDAVFICTPYILIAIGIMYYNAARFGSVFDFGATYSLTSNDMTRRGFNLHQALLGLWHYFMRPPVIESDFPFLQGIQIASASYMGKLNAEYTYGGIFACNAFLWILLYINRGKDLLKEKGIYVFSLLCIAISVTLSIVDVTGAGILQRYMVDMIWGVWLAEVLLWFAFAEKAAKQERLKPLMLLFTTVCLLQIVYGLGVVLGNGDLSVNVRTSNPRLYYYLCELFRF